MVFKFYVVLSEIEVIALRWKDGICSVGGYSKINMSMERLIKEFITERIPKVTFTQTNKIRFDLAISKERFNEVVENIQKAGISINPTKSFKRIMF
jgi:hypothetical protein